MVVLATSVVGATVDVVTVVSWRVAFVKGS